MSYRGWHLGIPHDSAQALARAQTGDSLTCDSRTLKNEAMCASSPDSAVNVSTMTTSGAPGPFDINVQLPLVVPRDSVVALFGRRWGRPNAPAETVASWEPTYAAAWRRGDTVITLTTYEKKRPPVMTVRISDAMHGLKVRGPQPQTLKDYAP